MPVHPPTYVDDFVLPIEAEDCHTLWLKLVAAAQIVHMVCRRHGLELNLNAGKTEAIIAWAGPGAVELRRWVSSFWDEEQQAAVMPTPIGPLRVVPKYKHLGSIAQPERVQMREVTAICQAGRTATAAFSRQLLSNPRLDTTTRLQVLRAVIHTKVLNLSGTWDPMTKEHLDRIAAALEEPLRKVVQAGHRYGDGQEAHRPTNRQVREQLGVPCVEALLISSQLQCAARLSCHGMDSTFALAQSEGAQSWRCGLLAGLEVFRGMLLDKLSSLPMPRDAPREWEEFWRAWPCQWRELQHLFLDRAVKREDELYELCRAAGVGLSSQAGGEVPTAMPCPYCNLTFTSAAAVWAHTRHAHGARCHLRDRVQGSLCQFCGQDFGNRVRLRKHLRHGKQSCVVAALSLPVLDEDIVLAEDEQEREHARQCRRQGRRPDARHF